MEIFVQRYYIIAFSILSSLTFVLFFWFEPKTLAGEDYTRWYLKHMLITLIETLVCVIVSKKVQNAFQKNYKILTFGGRLELTVKVAPRVNHKMALVIVDLLHFAICLWGMIIYWENYSFIKRNYKDDTLVLITCPLFSALGILLSTLRLIFFSALFIIVPYKVSQKERRRQITFIHKLQRLQLNVCTYDEYQKAGKQKVTLNSNYCDTEAKSQSPQEKLELRLDTSRSTPDEGYQKLEDDESR